MRMRLAYVALVLASCGGGESAPGPLRHTLDDKYLVSIEPREQEVVLRAKTEYDRARLEQDKAQADFDDSTTKLEIARNEADQALLSLKSARSEKRAADASADLTRKNNADRDLRTAELGHRAADAKISFLKAKRAYLKVQIRYCQYEVYAREAKWQLEKAKLLQAKNIRPPGFEYTAFETQYRQRSELAQRKKVSVDKYMQTAEAKRQEWNKADQEYMAAKGVKPAEAGTPGVGSSTQTPLPSVTSPSNNEPLK